MSPVQRRYGHIPDPTEVGRNCTSRPPFLDLLDEDPDGAFCQFYAFAAAQLERWPPAPMRTLSLEDRRDLFHDIVLHCVRNDFRVLRQYRAFGRPFGAWLYVVAHREALAFLRRKRRSEPDASREGGEASGAHRHLLERVLLVLAQMSEVCRRLLLLAADEYTPREIVRVLDLPDWDNKRVADQIRECRRRLKQRLEGAGVDWKQALDA